MLNQFTLYANKHKGKSVMMGEAAEEFWSLLDGGVAALTVDVPAVNEHAVQKVPHWFTTHITLKNKGANSLD